MSAERPTEPAEPGVAWGRVRDAVRLRGTRSQVLVAILLAGLGFAAAVQVHSTRKALDLSGAREPDLIRILDDLDQRQARLQTQLEDLESTKVGLQTGSNSRALAEAETRQRLVTLGVLAGTVPAVGPGVVVRVTDPHGAVDAGLVLSAVQELRDAGAEAIQVNDVRVVAASWFDDSSSGLVLSGTRLRAPYTIYAIGDARTIAEALRIPGGVVDSVRGVGGQVTVTERPSVTVSALQPVETPQYARPAPSSS
jgi:uncharacterized protein YlxW (UPF0749 family)